MTNDSFMQFNINEAARRADSDAAKNMGGCLGCIGAVFGVKIPNEITGPLGQLSSPGIGTRTVDGFSLFKETPLSKILSEGFPKGGNPHGDISESAAPSPGWAARVSGRSSEEGMSL